VSELASTHNINLITPIIGAPYTLKPKTTENKLVITHNLRWWDENNYQLSRKK
jgi:hypothetical protein